MKQILSILLISFFALKAQSQFYYYDILGTKQTNQLYKQLRTLQFKKITGVSYNGSEPSKDFILEQIISADGNNIITRSASIGNSESFFTSFFFDERVTNTTDSGNNAITKTNYEYDDSGRVKSINSISKDFDGTFMNVENHLWSYNSKGWPEHMLKIKNQTDTTFISFTYDEEGNVAEERWTKNNRRIETYYYYYNGSKQLTDIVRYNRKAKTMLPDFIFEYDNKGMISQMTQAQSGSANYLIWRYAYNEQGLKIREVAFNKQKELVGRIEYNYQ